MTKPRRITSLAQADEALNGLGYLEYAATPRRGVRRLLEVAAYYRGEVARLEEQLNQGKDTAWQKRVTK